MNSARTRLPRRGTASVANRMLWAQIAILVVGVIAMVAATMIESGRAYDARAAANAAALSSDLASDPAVIEAVDQPSGQARTQALLEQKFAETTVDFAVIVGRDGVRLAHTDDVKVGLPYTGTWQAAARGTPYTVIESGDRGVSLRAVHPIRAADGRVVGAAISGVTISRVNAEQRRELIVILVSVAVLSLVALGVTIALSRWLNRVTRGKGPAELSRSLDYYEAVVGGAGTGLILLDDEDRIVQISASAIELLGLDPAVQGGIDAVGRQRGGTAVRLSEVGLDEHVSAALLRADDSPNRPLIVGDRIVLVTRRDIAAGDDRGVTGRVLSLSDHSGARDLTDRLDGAERLVTALHEQTHEFHNRLHAIIWQLETGRIDAAISFATEELNVTSVLRDQLPESAPGEVGALLLGKRAQAGEWGIEFVIDNRSAELDAVLTPREAVTVLGNLIDNAFDAVRVRSETRRVTVSCRDVGAASVVIEVSDNGVGFPDGAAQSLGDGWTSKSGPGHGIGLALVRRIVDEHGGSVTVSAPTRGRGALVRVELPLAHEHQEDGDE